MSKFVGNQWLGAAIDSVYFSRAMNRVINMEDDDNTLDLMYEVDEEGHRVLVRSIESNQRAYLRFSNRTNRPVDVWWRDFRGLKRHYVRMQPYMSYDINSFVTHPWEFTDPVTKENYVINNRVVYRPPPNTGGMLYRTNWNITIRVRTLRDTALLAVASHVTRPSLVEDLGLPNVLKEDLQSLIAVLHSPPPPIPQRETQ